VHGARAPYIPGHAARSAVATVRIRGADDLAGGWVLHGQKRILDILLQDVVGPEIIVQGDTLLGIDIIRHVLAELSLAAKHEAVAGMVGGVSAIAALDIAAAQQRLYRLRVAEREVVAQAPEGAGFLVGQERVVAVDRVVAIRLLRG